MSQTETMTVQPGIVEVKELTIEEQLRLSGAMTVQRASELRVSNEAEYNDAAEFLKSIKTQASRIKAYWAEPKAKAAAAHKDIVNREKAMLTPLTTAESTVKASMSQYLAAVEKARREAEEEARRRQQEEAERLLNQAIDAEQAGDAQGTAVSLAMAEMVSDMQAPNLAAEAPKAAGVAQRKTWKARVTDAAQVPAYFNGMEIRTINQAALNNIARMTKGTASIPGIEFYEDSALSVRI